MNRQNPLQPASCTRVHVHGHTPTFTSRAAYTYHVDLLLRGQVVPYSHTSLYELAVHDALSYLLDPLVDVRLIIISLSDSLGKRIVDLIEVKPLRSGLGSGSRGAG